MREDQQRRPGNARRHTDEDQASIVDILQNELDKIEKEEKQEELVCKLEQKSYTDELTPALTYLREHLLKLIALLNHAQLKTRLPDLCTPELRYSVKYLGSILEGRQTNYKISTNKGGTLNGQRQREADFVLSCQFVPENKAEFALVDFREPGHIRERCEIEKYLVDHHLNFKTVESQCTSKMVKSLFTVSPIIDITFEFFGCPAKFEFPVRQEKEASQKGTIQKGGIQGEPIKNEKRSYSISG